MESQQGHDSTRLLTKPPPAASCRHEILWQLWMLGEVSRVNEQLFHPTLSNLWASLMAPTCIGKDALSYCTSSIQPGLRSTRCEPVWQSVSFLCLLCDAAWKQDPELASLYPCGSVVGILGVRLINLMSHFGQLPVSALDCRYPWTR